MAESHGKTKRGTPKVLILTMLVLLGAVTATWILFSIERDKHKLVKDYFPGGSEAGPKSESKMPFPGLTEGYVEAAAQIESAIDLSVSPCDDLYQYACGRWRKEHAIPVGEWKLDRQTMMQTDVRNVLQRLLEENIKPTDKEYVKQAKTYYASCQDMEFFNQKGDQPLRDALHEFGGWPLTTPGWSESNFDMVDLQLKLNKYNVRPVIFFRVSVEDPQDPTKSVSSIEGPKMDRTSRRIYTGERNSTLVTTYEELMFNVASALGFPSGSDLDQAKIEITEIVDFEIALVKIGDSKLYTEPTYERRTLSEIQAIYSKHFDWTRYVKKLLSQKEIGITDVTDKEVIIVEDPVYYHNLDELLDKTPKRTVVMYMIWRFVFKMLPALGDTYIDIMENYMQELAGVISEERTLLQCYQRTVQGLDLAVSKMYINYHFNMSTKDAVDDISKEIMNSLTHLLDNVTWMDKEAKKTARAKIKNMNVKIGYLDVVEDDKYIEEYYKNYSYKADEYFKNYLKTEAQSFYRNARRLRKAGGEIPRFDQTATAVIATYHFTKNQIVVPVGFLQPPIFNTKYPKSMGYGTVGVSIAHEGSHAFGIKGRFFTETGAMLDWWSNTTVDEFLEKAECFVDQYDNFTSPELGVTVNGERTFRQNFAENIGLHAAFKAYRNWVAKQGKEELTLPGLEFTPNQLFFLSFAQQRCSMRTNRELVLKFYKDGYSPSRFRVIGPVQNSREFSEAFKCPPNSPMNPVKKCEVW